MSLLKFLFGATSSKNESNYPSANNLEDALKRAEEIRCKMNGFNPPRKKKKCTLENGFTTGYAGTGHYSNGIRIDDDDREWYEH